MSERPARRTRIVEEDRKNETFTSDELESRVLSERKPGRMANEPKEPVFDYDADMEIDLNFLHLECQNHSVLFMKYGKEAARTKKFASFAEEKVKTIRSGIIKKLMDASDKKPTESVLEAGYRLDPEYIAAKEAWLEAVYEADIATNCVFGMQGRKSMLELEVKLHGQQYYSTPEVENLSEASKQFAELKTKSVEDRIRNQTNRR